MSHLYNEETQILIVQHYSPLHDQRFNRDFIMNTPNKVSTAQDTSDVAPASSSPKQEEDGDNESEKETTTTMSPENKVQKFFSTIERDAAVLAHRLDGIRRSNLKICTEKVSISSNSGVGVRQS